MMILHEVLRTENNNEICRMLSNYICKKPLQAAPEKIRCMKEEERAYEEALAKKKAQEQEPAKRLALINKRASQKKARNNDRRPAHFYIFSFNECFCKIGIANNVIDRRRTKIAETGRMIVQWAYSELFYREAAEEVEQLCHAHFNKFRTYREFFTITFDEACLYLQGQVKKPLVICKKEEK